MVIQVDYDSSTPLYLQIREQLREQIASGHLRTGDSLPTEMEICAQCGVSRMTVRQALLQLANDGLIVRKRARGTFVAAPKMVIPDVQTIGLSYTEIMRQIGIKVGSQVLSQKVIPADDEVAGRLKLPKGVRVIRIERTRSISGEVMLLEIVFFPYARFPALAEADLSDTSIYHYLKEEYKTTPAYALDSIEISTAKGHHAGLLTVTEGAPIALVATTGFLADGTPIFYSHTIHRGDRFRAMLRRGH